MILLTRIERTKGRFTHFLWSLECKRRKEHSNLFIFLVNTLIRCFFAENRWVSNKLILLRFSFIKMWKDKVCNYWGKKVLFIKNYNSYFFKRKINAPKWHWSKNCKIWMTSVLGKKETPIHVMRLRFCLNLVYTRKQW